MRVQSSFSPRSKNMPRLVRASLTSLAPVSVLTVSERARRGRASSISWSHSSSDSRPPKTMTRGLFISASTRTSRSPAQSVAGRADRPRSGSGTGTGGGSSAWRARSSRKPRSVSSSALTATSSRQPLASIDFRTASGCAPAVACSMIHWRSSGVTGCIS